MFITAFCDITDVDQWIVTIIGYLGIVFMFSDAHRLKIRQNKNYNSLTEYQK